VVRPSACTPPTTHFQSQTNQTPTNQQMLGLQLPNYVPGAAPALDAAGWTGVVVKQRALLGMFNEHLTTPLLAMASEPTPSAPSGPLLQTDGDGGGGVWWLPPAGSAERRIVFAAASVVGAALAVGAVALVVRQRRVGRGGGGLIKGLFGGA